MSNISVQYVDGLEMRNSELEADNRLLETQLATLKEALRNLMNETSGMLHAHEFSIRADSGNTNFAVYQLRVAEARAALAKVEEK